jgi:hypothetical protein
MVIDNTISDSLRGQPFIRKIESYEAPGEELERRIYGDNVERTCGHCYYHGRHPTEIDNCYWGPSREECKPKQLFGIKPEDSLPSILDGKEVAHYCPFFTHYLVREFESELSIEMICEAVGKKDNKLKPQK